MYSPMILISVCIAVVHHNAYKVVATGCSGYDLGSAKMISNPELSKGYLIGNWAVGKKVYIEGKDTSRTRFSFNFVDEATSDKNVVMHVDFRTNYGKVPHVAYNTRRDNVWTDAYEIIEYTKDTWPIEENLSFCTEVMMLQDSFKITVTKSTGEKLFYCFQYKNHIMDILKNKPLYFAVYDSFDITKMAFMDA